MKKIFSFLAAVLFAGSMMAAEATLQYSGSTTTNMVGDGNNAATLGLDETLFSVTAEKGEASNLPGLNKAGDIRLYAHSGSGNGNIITVTIANGTINSIAIDYNQQATHVVKAGETVVTGTEGVFAINATSFSIQNTTSGASTQLRLNKITITYTGEGDEPVEPGDEPSVLQAVSDSTTWDFSKITANTENALYKKEGIQLTDESTPSKNDEVIYADYSADFMTIGEDFNKAAIAFKGEYPIRKNQYCQAGTLHFKADVAGTIVVKFSDTGTSASESAVKRYLVVNGDQTEYWTSRENNGTEAYDAQLNVVSGKIAVPAGDVTITGSSAIVVYYVTFVPAQAVEPEGPKNLGAKTIAEFLELKNTTDTCILTGVVSNIANAVYGNFDLTDESGTVYVYGLLTPAGESQKFADLNVAEKDTLTVLAIYNEHNGNPQAKNAIFVEVKKSSAPVVEPVNLGAKTIAEFLELKNTKDTCILTGVVSNIANAVYGNFDLTDESGTVYVYGLLTPAGESQKFADLNVAEKDTLTVLAIYNEYKGNPQAKNAIFVEVKKAAVEPGETIEISLTSETANVDWKDATATSGWWQMRAWNDDYFITLSNAGSLTQAAGTYTVADLDPDYSYILAYNETDTVRVDFTEGSVEVTDNGEGTVSVAGTLTGSDGNAYVISIISLPDPYKYDEAEADFEYTFESYKSQVGQGYAIVQAQTNDAMIALAIFLPQGQTELVAGEYAVSATPAYSTVYAGSYDDGFNPSFAATLVEEEGKLYYNQIWYLVSGKVTLDENLNITVDALNSNEKTVKATLKAQSQGIEDVNAAAKAVKSIVNGQLIIEKNGVQYNAQGAVIR